MGEFEIGDRVEIVREPPFLRGKVGLQGVITALTPQDEVWDYDMKLEDDLSRGCYVREGDIRKLKTFSDTLDNDQKISAFKVGQWVEVIASPYYSPYAQVGAKGRIAEVGKGSVMVEGVHLEYNSHYLLSFSFDEVRLLGSDEIPHGVDIDGNCAECDDLDPGFRLDDGHWETFTREPIAKDAKFWELGVLNPDDPFEAAVIDIVAINRKKRADYATDDDIFSNFRGAGRRTGLDAGKIVDVMLAIKDERMAALSANGREPNNESVLDTLLDRACYAVIGYALGKEQANDDHI